MKILHSTYSKYFLFSSITILLALAIIFPGAEKSSAHGYKYTSTITPTTTAIPSPTSTPELQACQVTGVKFLEDFYSGQEKDTFFTNETINVRVSVADSLEQPLVGANVAAEVVRQPLSIQSAIAIELDDRAGDYDGTYGNTENPGIYQFSFTVSDPTGERFLPCSGQASIQIDPEPVEPVSCQISAITDKTEYALHEAVILTATVTIDGQIQSGAVVTGTAIRPDTSEDGPFNFTGDGPYTGSYTNTNLAGSYTFKLSGNTPQGQCNAYTTTPVTVTPAISQPDPAINIAPNPLETTLCSLKDTVAVKIENVVDLAIIEMDVTYDPAIIQVIDADTGQRGVQVRVDAAFSTDTIFRNTVDTDRGRISFGAGVIGVPAINGNSGIIAIDWRPQHVGSSAVTIENITLLDVNGLPISATVQGSTVDVQFVPNCLSGTVALQGRNNHQGIIVTNGTGDQTITLPDGSFGLPAGDSLNFEFPAYVAAAVNLQQALTTQQNNQPIKLDPVTLLAGDINNDNIINIFDLAYLATNYQTADTLADLNADGTANILDIALLAGNFRQAGPVASSQ